ncbi:MAG: hypothetical protein HC927_00350 [Deltaproteobacteria bacterium]|nr:hypothetical protein [Deltaproteobacteria bacterium]
MTAVLASGCTASTKKQAEQLDSRISELEREEARRQAKLTQLDTQIGEAERKLAQAQEQARRASCKAERVAAEAALAQQEATCGVQLAQFEACVARNESHTSKGTAVGCGLGILAGIVSGGALAPLALAGCAGGYAAGKMSEGECGRAPTCHVDLPERQRIVRTRVERLLACEQGLSNDNRTRQPARGRPGARR